MKLVLALLVLSLSGVHAQTKNDKPIANEAELLEQLSDISYDSTILFDARYFDAKKGDTTSLWTLDFKSGNLDLKSNPELKIAAAADGSTIYSHGDDQFLKKEVIKDGTRYTGVSAGPWGEADEIASVVMGANGMESYTECDGNGCQVYSPKVCDAFVKMGKVMMDKTDKIMECTQTLATLSEEYQKFNETNSQEFDRLENEKVLEKNMDDFVKSVTKRENKFKPFSIKNRELQSPLESFASGINLLKPIALKCKEFVEKGYMKMNFANGSGNQKKQNTTKQ